jgi:4-hydroxy-tetrahydrodipicolinate synthase
MARPPAWLDGVLAGAVTPFDADGRLDEPSLAAHLTQLADGGVDSLVVCADTGEGQHLDQRERTEVLRLAIAEVGERVPVLTGLIASFTAEAAERAREAEQAGAVGLQVFPPPAFLGRTLDPGMAAGYVEGIAAATSLPLIVYRPPVELGYGIDDAVVARLIEIDGVAALKESSFDPRLYRRSLAIVRAAEHDVAFLSGADTFVLESMEVGFDGMALAIAALAPGAYADLLATWRADRAAGAELARTLEPISETIFAAPFRDFRARLKEGLRQLGVIRSAHVRAPLTELSAAEPDAIAAMLARTGLAVRS